MATTLERVKEIIKPISYCETLNAETKLCSLHLDDIDLVELVNGVEEEFAVEIEDGVAEKFKTILDIIEYVNSKTERA